MLQATMDKFWWSKIVTIPFFFPRSRLITGYLMKVKRWVPLVKQELLTVPEHLGASPVLFWCDSCCSTCSYLLSLIKVRNPSLLSIFYQLLTSRCVGYLETLLQKSRQWSTWIYSVSIECIPKRICWILQKSRWLVNL